MLFYIFFWQNLQLFYSFLTKFTIIWPKLQFFHHPPPPFFMDFMVVFALFWLNLPFWWNLQLFFHLLMEFVVILPCFDKIFGFSWSFDKIHGFFDVMKILPWALDEIGSSLKKLTFFWCLFNEICNHFTVRQNSHFFPVTLGQNLQYFNFQILSWCGFF